MLKNIVIRMQNLGKEIFGIFLLVCGVEIIIPIAVKTGENTVFVALGAFTSGICLQGRTKQVGCEEK